MWGNIVASETGEHFKLPSISPSELTIDAKNHNATLGKCKIKYKVISQN